MNDTSFDPILLSAALIDPSPRWTPDPEEMEQRWKEKAWEAYNNLIQEGGIPSREVHTEPIWKVNLTDGGEYSFHLDEQGTDYLIEPALLSSFHWKHERTWFEEELEDWRQFCKRNRRQRRLEYLNYQEQRIQTLRGSVVDYEFKLSEARLELHMRSIRLARTQKKVGKGLKRKKVPSSERGHPRRSDRIQQQIKYRK
ncbi:hypothetical protein EPUS_05727 [Endocarpon pusillum Z07020]|uniref:Uncharacterized protein n=1 Tax=Endocarpon pusillum (strain Z07020 / HMAS-L-300199) TaxID=1263415 RepID=U1GAH2_ENDPU|nr:uncharacterized protein EPUS_05727 [Endocarpon pusillum Z07020]ERF68666.1 hypothetical protein EPUS_05727 [Endocarpon pusillum Z07020]